MPFHGIHDHTLDSKNRLTVPSKARALLAGGVTLSIGLEPCLQVWPAADHEQLVRQTLAQVTPMSRQARDLKRFFFANTVATELDSAGRVMVPPTFAAHASLEKAVTVVGAADCLELWEPEAWTEHNAALTVGAADLIETIGHPA